MNIELFSFIRNSKQSTMASWDATYDKYRVKKLSRLTKDTTEEEVKELYKAWAATYEKVISNDASA